MTINLMLSCVGVVLKFVWILLEKGIEFSHTEFTFGCSVLLSVVEALKRRKQKESEQGDN